MLNIPDDKKVIVNADRLKSLYGSNKIADGFNVKYKVCKTTEVDNAINSTIADKGAK